MSSGDVYQSHAPPDAGLADSAAVAVAKFVSQWAARGVQLAKVLDAVSAAVVQVGRTNSNPVSNDDLSEKVQAVVKSGGLPPPEPEDDILGGTDLDSGVGI